MSSINSYLIRAWVDWMEDNGLSAHLVVATNISGVDVPFEFAKDNQIVLCIDSEAVTNLLITTSGISFNASFNGVSRVCAFPYMQYVRFMILIVAAAPCYLKWKL